MKLYVTVSVTDENGNAVGVRAKSIEVEPEPDWFTGASDREKSNRYAGVAEAGMDTIEEYIREACEIEREAREMESHVGVLRIPDPLDLSPLVADYLTRENPIVRMLRVKR